MDCPQCSTVLRERDRSGIKIDFCPDCKDVWLDRGELDKLIERESSGEDEWDDRRGVSVDRSGEERDRERPRESGYDQRSEPCGGYQQKPSKKKSFFETLSDLAGGGED